MSKIKVLAAAIGIAIVTATAAYAQNGFCAQPWCVDNPHICYLAYNCPLP